MSVTVTVHHIFAPPLPLVWQRYHFGTIFRTPWGSKHCFHGNISETHIDKRIGAAVFSPMTNETSKAEGGFSRWTQLNACNICGGEMDRHRRGNLSDFSPRMITKSRSHLLYIFLFFFSSSLLFRWCQSSPLALALHRPTSGSPAVLESSRKWATISN